MVVDDLATPDGRPSMEGVDLRSMISTIMGKGLGFPGGSVCRDKGRALGLSRLDLDFAFFSPSAM